MGPGSQLRATFIGGSIAGALDILFAIALAMFNGRTATWLLQTVAAGILGSSAYEGGAASAVLGLAAHFVLSFAWAALFVAVAARRPPLVRQPFLAALLFGLFVFLAMRLVVLPLSAFPYPVSVFSKAAGLDLLSHVFLFAGPIVLAAAKLTPRKEPP